MNHHYYKLVSVDSNVLLKQENKHVMFSLNGGYCRVFSSSVVTRNGCLSSEGPAVLGDSKDHFFHCFIS